MVKFAKTHFDLDVYRKAFDAAVEIHVISKSFPEDEKFSLTSQIRRSSRSVCANIAEAWRKRRYKRAFINKLSDAESEAGETQVWLEFAIKFDYLERGQAKSLFQTYDEILRTLVGMINNPGSWLLKGKE